MTLKLVDVCLICTLVFWLGIFIGWIACWVFTKPLRDRIVLAGKRLGGNP